MYTNTILHKMKKKKQPDCPYYHGIDQTPLQIFVECSIAKSLWNKFHKVVQHYMWRKHCFGAERNYIWCFKIHIVLFNSESLNHNWKYMYFLYINGVHEEKWPQLTDFVTLVSEKIKFEYFTQKNNLRLWQTNYLLLVMVQLSKQLIIHYINL